MGRVFWIELAAVAIIVDQLTKAVSSSYGLLWLNTQTPILSSLTVKNTQLMGLILVLLLTVGVWRAQSKAHKIGLALMLGGGVSNWLDIVATGGIRDFLIKSSYGVNLADIFIIAGAVIIIIRLVLGVLHYKYNQPI